MSHGLRGRPAPVRTRNPRCASRATRPWLYCARLTATHYENFSVVTRLTPRGIGPRSRASTPSADGPTTWATRSATRGGRSSSSTGGGASCGDVPGHARHPVMIALAETVARYGIPIEPFEALISAFEQDQSVTEYLSYSNCSTIARGRPTRSAGWCCTSPGRSARRMPGSPTPPAPALQLANFWQDVARDLAIGRIYLPREDRDRFGYPESDLRALRFTPAFAELMKFEVERTRGLLRRGRALVPRVPRAFAVDIDLFSRGGLAILDRIEARGFDVLSARPTLSRWTKLRLLGRAVVAMTMARCSTRHPASATNGAHETARHRRRIRRAPREDGPVLEESYRFCARCRGARRGTSTMRSCCLPRSRRRSMCALYAFMRHTDDLADEPGTRRGEGPTHSTPGGGRSMPRWPARRGDAWPGLPALADTVARHGIPAKLLHEVIEGVSMDIQPRGFATFAELADYCYHVASVVGLSCLHIWGYRSEGGKAERLAEHCGIALQLTNILRDVGDDARNGRIYLPRDDLARFGVEPEELAAGGRPSDRVRELLAFEGATRVRIL